MGLGRNSNSRRSAEGNSKQKGRELALPPRAGCADNNGGKCQSRTSFPKALQLKFSDQFAASKPAGIAPSTEQARKGQSKRQGSGVVGAPARSTPPSHAEPTVSQQWGVNAGTPSGLPTGVAPRGFQGAPRGLCPGPAPLTHTVSQQHQSRLARPRSAAADQHKPS